MRTFLHAGLIASSSVPLTSCLNSELDISFLSASPIQFMMRLRTFFKAILLRNSGYFEIIEFLRSRFDQSLEVKIKTILERQTIFFTTTTAGCGCQWNVKIDISQLNDFN